MTTATERSSLADIHYRDTSCVLLYDPKDLAEVDLNLLRRDTPFEEIQYSKSEVPGIAMQSEERFIRAVIQYTRLEFVQMLDSPFAERSMDVLGQIMRALPELSVKSFGLNYTVAWTTADSEPAGQYVCGQFLSPQARLEEQLGNRVFAGSVRMFFGEPGQYRDLRLTPETLKSDNVVLQYHYHNEESVRDRDRLIRLLAEQYASELPRLTRALETIRRR